MHPAPIAPARIADAGQSEVSPALRLTRRFGARARRTRSDKSPRARNFRETGRHVLERRVVDRTPRQLAPSFDPAPAKIAVAIEDDERFGWRLAHGGMKYSGH